jgi:hypothetical protein
MHNCRELLFVSAALEVGFSEVDYGVDESDGRVPIILTVSRTRGENSEATLKVVPMTLAEYENMTGALPHGISAEDDPAEPGKLTIS